MSNSPSAATVLDLLQQAEQQLEMMIPSTPQNFGPATLVSVTGQPTPMGTIAPYTLVFQPVGGGTALTFVVQKLPLGISQANIGQIFTGQYVESTAVPGQTVLSNLTLEQISFTGVLLKLSPLTFVPTTGGNLIVLNVQAPPSGLTPGTAYNVTYVPAAANGTVYDLVVGTPSAVALS
jgi:hypothetical protein